MLSGDGLGRVLLAALGVVACMGLGWLAALVAIVRALADPSPASPMVTVLIGCALLPLTGLLSGASVSTRQPSVAFAAFVVGATAVAAVWACDRLARRLAEPSPLRHAWVWAGLAAAGAVSVAAFRMAR